MFRNLFGPFDTRLTLNSLFSDFNKAFDLCFKETMKSGRGTNFPTEIISNDKNTVVSIALAGISKERVKVKVKDGEMLIVTVLGEEGEPTNRFSSKTSEMTFVLLAPIEKVEPVMKDGLLTITLIPVQTEKEDSEKEVTIA